MYQAFPQVPRYDFSTTGVTASPNVDATHTYADNGNYTVTAFVFDNATGFSLGFVEEAIQIENVRPTGDATNNGPTDVGYEVTVNVVNLMDVGSGRHGLAFHICHRLGC